MTELITNGRLKIDTNSQTVFLNQRKLEVTSSEYKLLVALNKNIGELFFRDKLDAIVWDKPPSPWASDRGVSTLIYGLRKKIPPNYIFSYANYPTGYKASNTLERRMLTTGIIPGFRFQGERQIGDLYINMTSPLVLFEGKNWDMDLSQYRLLAVLAKMSPNVVPISVLRKLTQGDKPITELEVKTKIAYFQTILKGHVNLRSATNIGYELRELHAA